MSMAGIRSNRGDGYQTLVAFDWALTVLTDPEFLWIEIDSTSYPVDDVVIGKHDGSIICCQCKKNQIDFSAWTIADLADELCKVSKLFDSKNNIEARFYSRSPFGALAKLREYSVTQADETSYHSSLSKEQQKTDAELKTRLTSQTLHLTTYNFLRRISFETSPELDRMEDLLHERLRLIASNPKIAYNALWKHLDQFGARMNSGDISISNQHRMTKDDIKTILHEAGAMLVPIMSLTEVRESFSTTSAIGRSWKRDIAGQRIPILLLNDIINAIYSGKRSILLTGLPGSGKTCVMLALQDELEQRAKIDGDVLPLFIQAREFADLITAQDRQAQGLSEQWVEKTARLAEEVRVVVVIDSLDVLSISREHIVLTYFLAQIDRLLLIPNITVITACRDFDRHYDFRIAKRQWDFEVKCPPLNWETEILPLFDSLGINAKTIDIETRELIRNPRELALFIELAQREGNFKIITSQALAQRYLNTIVMADNNLGETAMHAIESLADEMLKTRKLAVPHQRFTASQDTRRLLCSLNVLQETQSGELMFGHQTLLDVLVISRAIRKGITLNNFIQNLPPVPFVRPSIRSFVMYLAMGDRREFRKQVRTIITGAVAFHIRRLVAESFAEQIPQDDDWLLIHELWEKHREVFQVVYVNARLIGWHHFWLKHLVPVLKDTKDAEGMISHAHRISQWKNEDTSRVVAFWMEILKLDWIDGKQISSQLSYYLSDIDIKKLALVGPLVEQLLDMPRNEHISLGHIIAKCVSAGVLENMSLWRYIAGEINDDDAIKYHFGNKLHCQSHEFGNSHDKFLNQQMTKSIALLDLALESVERWSRIKSAYYGNDNKGYYSNYLSVTSYDHAHSQSDMRHHDSDNILFDAIEAAILDHAKTNSAWWKVNRERICFSHEGALRYFSIRAFILNPESNIDLIERLLVDKELLASDLSFELGTLIESAFIYLSNNNQNEILKCVLALGEEDIEKENLNHWILKRRAELILAIPCHLRSFEAHTMLDDYKRIYGLLIRQPSIFSHGGMVRPPFTFEVFLHTSDIGVIKLLTHYAGHESRFDEFLIGGEREVGSQLSEASSRHPIRFLSLLVNSWSDIPEVFYNYIIDGIARYLEYQYGNLRNDNKWEPIVEPTASDLTNRILDELERHSKHWHHNRSASNIIRACAHIIKDAQDASRLVFLTIGFTNLQEESTISDDSVDIMTKGINMISGHVAEALIILANSFQERSSPFPDLLLPTLRRFAMNEHPAVRALILRHLPYLQSKNYELGWDLFYFAMKDSKGLWRIAEPCLYYTYYNHFKDVAPLLIRILYEGKGKDMETWGRISALAALSNHIEIDILLNDLKNMEDIDAWRGVASVWTHPVNYKQHHEQCIMGIEAGLESKDVIAGVVAGEMVQLFREKNTVSSLPIKLIHLYFLKLEYNSENKNMGVYGFDEWLNATSQNDPLHALDATEVFLAYVSRKKPYLYDHENNLTQLMTRLFAESEEREESDNGMMLQRVALIQEALLSLGVNGVSAWLKAAERP